MDRTIYMRLSRKIDITLQDHTEFIEIRRNSPLWLSIIQNIDPTIIVGIWNAFNLDQYLVEYSKGEAHQALEFVTNPTNLSIANLAQPWLIRSLDRSQAKKDKEEMLDIQKRQYEEMKGMRELMDVVAKSVSNTPEHHKNEVKKLEERIDSLEKQIETLTGIEKKKLKALKSERTRKKNLEVKVNRKNRKAKDSRAKPSKK